MRARHTAAALVLALALGGCASMTDTERRAAGGTAMAQVPVGDVQRSLAFHLARFLTSRSH